MYAIIAAALLSTAQPTYTTLNLDMDSACHMRITENQSHVDYLYGEHGGSVLYFPNVNRQGNYEVVMRFAHGDYTVGEGEMVQSKFHRNATMMMVWLDDDSGMLEANEIVVYRKQGNQRTVVERHSLKGSYRAFANFFDRCD